METTFTGQACQLKILFFFLGALNPTCLGKPWKCSLSHPFCFTEGAELYVFFTVSMEKSFSEFSEVGGGTYHSLKASRKQNNRNYKVKKAL